MKIFDEDGKLTTGFLIAWVVIMIIVLFMAVPMLAGVFSWSLEKELEMSREKKALLKLAEDCIQEGSDISLRQAELYIKLAELHH